MNKRRILLNWVVVLMAGLLLAGVGMANSSNKWRLQFSGGAHSDGVIVMELTPVDGELLTVSIDALTALRKTAWQRSWWMP